MSQIQEEYSPSNAASNLHQHISVMDGVEVDKAMADKWLTNQDKLCPKVIADDTEDDECENQDFE